MPGLWCLVCHTRHAPEDRCPGELVATGPERHGWRVRVRTPAGTEIYGVLVAEAGEVWRARILTLPRQLWSVPGGRGTMKFLGDTATQAEAGAIEFIREHCRLRGFTIEDGAEAAPTGPPSAARAAAPRTETGATPRHPRSLVARFGEGKPDRVGMTADVSINGMFVITDRPLAEGRSVKLLIELDGYSVPLVGKVAWIRRRAEQGRPAGMGIALKHPPNVFVRFVRSLDAELPDPD